MADRTRLKLVNIQDKTTVVLGATAHAVDSTDVSNGVQIVDFFENVDNSGILVLANPSASTGCVVTIKANSNNIGGDVGDLSVTLAPSQTKIINIIDSSRFGQNSTGADGTKFVGLYIDTPTTSDTNNLTIEAFGKLRQSYTAPTLS